MVIEMKKGAELRGRYVVSELLGMGGFATVWRATDKQEARDVAIKRLLRTPGNDLERLLNEARKTAKLRGHKNIVEIYEVFEEEGEGFLVMEHVDGQSLDDLLRSHIVAKTWIESDDALDYFRQLVEGLVFAHSSGLYHRDVKPNNILISKLGVVKLVDFGLARSMVPDADTSGRGETGLTFVGTPNFMSPEQARGEVLDHLTDVFSAGIVGYILLTGRHPFNHPSAVTAVLDLVKDQGFTCDEIDPIHLKGVPTGILKALSRMLAKERGERCQSLIEVLTELTKEAGPPCPNCGNHNPTANLFCGQCGDSLTRARSEETRSASGATRLLSVEELADEGFALTRDQNWVGAIAKYREAIDQDPAYGKAYYNLGYALNHLGKYDEAIEELSKGLDVCDDFLSRMRLYDTRGFARLNLKNYEGAIADFTESLKIHNNNVRVLQHRAEARALAEEYDAAYSDVLMILKSDPDNPKALRLKFKLESQGLVKPLGTRRAVF